MKNSKSKIVEMSDELSLKNEIIGILFLFISIFTIFSLISYHPYDPSFFHSTMESSVKNFGGRLGSEISALFFNFLGYASYIVVIYLLFVSSFYFINKKIQNIITKSSGYLLLVVSFSAMLANISPFRVGDDIHTGGIFGYFLNQFFQGTIKRFFAFMLYFILCSIALALIARFSLRKLLKLAYGFTFKGVNKAREILADHYAIYRKNRQRKKVEEKYHIEPEVVEEEEESSSEYLPPRIIKSRKKDKKNRRQIVKTPSKLPEEMSLFTEFEDDFTDSQGYKAPPLSYLDASTQKSQIDYNELEDKKEELAHRLVEFKIKGGVESCK